jgi:hypothetical protein
MPWNAANRTKYEVIRDCYSSDMSDAAFEPVAPLRPAFEQLEALLGFPWPFPGQPRRSAL